jgi:hypothetical protein
VSDRGPVACGRKRRRNAASTASSGAGG